MKSKITIFFILSFAIFSCNYGENIEIESYPKDSITLSINTKMNVTQRVSPMTSRSTPVNETMYENLNLYIFDENGTIFDYRYATKSSDLNNIKLAIWKEKKHSIYGIANAGKNIYAKTINELTEKSHKINSISEMSSPNGGVIMTGHIPPCILKDGMSLDLTLIRSVAKISFRIDLENLSSETSINISKVSIKNIPNKVNLFKDSKAISIEDVIIEGDSRNGNELNEIEKSGCSFYIYENMQGGNLLPTNNTQQGKTFGSTDPRAKLCSYLEIESNYNSPIHNGTIKHRFYLGKDHLTDFNIIRNKHYTHTLSFIGSGINEVSWRIDVGDLKEYITSLNTSPSEYMFRELHETKQISTTILPNTAFNKNLSWNSSDTRVATVDISGIVESISDGNCIITATATDGSNKTASSKINVEVPQLTISCQETMFKGENTKAIVTTLIPSNTPIIWTSSDKSVLTIDQLGNIQAVGIGNATIRGDIIRNKYSEHTVSVLPLTLSLSSPISTFYKGFRETIKYSIAPTHAQKLHDEGKLPITWMSENNNINNDGNIYWGKKIGEDKIIGYFTDFSNIRVSTNTTTQEAIVINPNYHSPEGVMPPYIRILNNADISKKFSQKYSDISIYHLLNILKHHKASVSWTYSNSNIMVNSSNQIYCTNGNEFGTNGGHYLIGSIVDDFNITHQVRIQLRIYEEVNIVVTYYEKGPEGPRSRIGIGGLRGYYKPSSNKKAGNINFKHFAGLPSWSINNNEGWEIKGGFLSGGTSGNLTQTKHYNAVFPNNTIIIEDGTSLDGKYRYYISIGNN